MTPPDPSDPLSRTLAAWRVNPPVDPAFRPAVWARLRQPAPETWGSYLRSNLLGWSLVAGVAIAAAGLTGRSVAEARLEADREKMVVSYLGNLDPRVLVKLRPNP